MNYRHNNGKLLIRRHTGTMKELCGAYGQLINRLCLIAFGKTRFALNKTCSRLLYIVVFTMKFLHFIALVAAAQVVSAHCMFFRLDYVTRLSIRDILI